MIKQKIYATIGISGSGKSTWANKFSEENDIPIVSSDAIREELGDINDQSQNKKVFQIFHSRVARHLDEGKSVIADATNYSEQAREPFFDIAKQKGVDIEWQYFNTPLKLCISRNNKRNRKVPEDVIMKQWRRLTLPWDNVKFHYIDYSILMGLAPHQIEEVKKRKCIIFDLDGTLALNNSGRSPFDGTRVFEDDVNPPVLDILHKYIGDNNYNIIFLSGREGTSTCRKETMRFLLEKCGLKNYNKPEQWGLIMRAEKDHRKDWLIKWELFEECIRPYYGDVLFVLDDRTQVVNMWRNGPKLTCFQVANGDF